MSDGVLFTWKINAIQKAYDEVLYVPVLYLTYPHLQYLS